MKTVDELISDLGETEEEVVKTLLNKNIKGELCDPINCPIANYLIQELYPNEEQEDIIQVSTYITDLIKDKTYVIPIHVDDFIDHFDNEKYPELIK
jgi:hypothetical protein